MKPLLTLLALLAAAPLVRADHPDRDDWDEPRVIVYAHANFRGAALELHPGDRLDNLSGQHFPDGQSLNDRISSIRVEGGAVVYVYEHGGFRGAVMRLTESVRDLSLRRLPDNAGASWNDRISSLVVEARRRGPRDGREADPDDAVRRAYRELLGRGPDEGGFRYYRSLMIDQGWTERMVRDHIRRSEEYRREGADRIIRRAYEDLLGRAPDESGAQHYRRMLIERDWSEQELRDNIRSSAEYRERVAVGKTPRG